MQCIGNINGSNGAISAVYMYFLHTSCSFLSLLQFLPYFRTFFRHIPNWIEALRKLFLSKISGKGTVVLSRLYSQYYFTLCTTASIVTRMICTSYYWTLVVSSRYHIVISPGIYNIDSGTHRTLVINSKGIRNNMQTLTLNLTDVLFEEYVQYVLGSCYYIYFTDSTIKSERALTQHSTPSLIRTPVVNRD